MRDSDLQLLRAGVRDVPDFPKAGILFKDITPILADPGLFSLALDALAETADGRPVDKIVGVDARGFIFGAALADRLKVGFIPMRKKGKLPYRTESCTYELEYGEAEMEVHQDAIAPGERILLVDDLLATGGTAAAALQLIERVGGTVTGASFLIELTFLHGRVALGQRPVTAVLAF